MCEFKIEIVVSKHEPKYIIHNLQYYFDECLDSCDADITHEIVENVIENSNIQCYTIIGYCCENFEYLQNKLKPLEDFVSELYDYKAVAELTIL